MQSHWIHRTIWKLQKISCCCCYTHMLLRLIIQFAHSSHPNLWSMQKKLLSITMFCSHPSVTSLKGQITLTKLIHLYAKELLTLSLIWHGFHNASQHSDGDRIYRYWKILLVVFKSDSTDRRNYGKEAVNLLLQHDHLLSPRKAAQLKWSRCINTTGQVGANIPCDLHLEHLNRRLKGILRNLGSNITSKSIVKAGQTVATVHRVCQVFLIHNNWQTEPNTSSISIIS